MNNTPPLILHHYAGSPFSMKIIWALTIKRLPWNSVIVPPILPRPLLKPLTHEYRRIPVLQIGSDVFVDTSMILEELERRYPDPSLFPKRKGSDKSEVGLAKSVIYWTDRHFFSIALRSSYAGINPSTPKIFTSKEFLEDRSALLGQRIDLEKISSTRPHILDEIRSFFELTESQLNENQEWFLDTTRPGIVDIHVGAQLFFLRITKSANEIANPENYPKTFKWYERFKNYINEIQQQIPPPIKTTSEEALNIAKQYKPVTARVAQLEDKNDLLRKIGDRVKIEPDDYGRFPTTGTIVSLGNSHVAIIPDGIDKTGIEVAIWFPRIGYRITLVNDNNNKSKL